MRRVMVWLAVPVAFLVLFAWRQPEPSVVRVGSKGFTESVVLGEICTQLVASAGVAAEHESQLGGTRIVWNALLAGELDVYVEYTGTLREEIFAGRPLVGEQALRSALEELGVRMSAPLGFDNTYAFGMRSELADELGIRCISDLRRHPDLAFGFSNEFLDRGDGWPSVRDAYDLPQRRVRGLDHALAYRGLAADEIQVMDLYATDAEIEYYGLRVLADDRGHFPAYEAVVLSRIDLERRAPEAIRALARLERALDEARMVTLNARAKIERVPEARVAADFLGEAFGIHGEVTVQGPGARLTQRTAEHLFLVGCSLGAALLVGLPLGVLAFLRPRWRHGVLGLVSVVQTIPSLVLFVLFIQPFGLGTGSAIATLFLYSLLPIVRATHAGLAAVPRELSDSAIALGLPRGARLRLVELPLAARGILAGIKTAAVINVGAATLAALIGAGGYGQPILTGLRLDDTGLMLEGAVPAAVLALLAQEFFDRIERRVLSRGLRLASRGLG